MKYLVYIMFLAGFFLPDFILAQTQDPNDSLYQYRAYQRPERPYTTAAGLRLGRPISLSFKQFVNGDHAIEAWAGLRSNEDYNWYNISVAYLVHNPIEDVEGLWWYYGAGPGFFVWDGKEETYIPEDCFNSQFADEEWCQEYTIGEGYSVNAFGLQGYIGLEYILQDLPIALSIDWVPIVYFSGGLDTGFSGGFGAIGARYMFNQD
ncbi:MAG: hypothetical protein AAF694_13080 [Bacteroidota bacterium]